MRRLALLCMFIFVVSALVGQQDLNGGYIVLLRDEFNLKAPYDDPSIRCISKELGVYYTKDSSIAIKKNIPIKAIIPNLPITSRSMPDDPQLSRQWYLNYTNMDKIWDVTTGNSPTKNIVIAVVDENMDIKHEDLQENMYINPNEIPNDRIDNDKNGYVDDVTGLNTDRLGSNMHDIGGGHGTWVAGVAGARGNNNIGVTGVMWASSILPLSGVNTSAEVFLAYQYLYQMRKSYNESNGKLGANIVVSNLSLATSVGVAGLKETWCSFYDLMGSVGILSIGAVPNATVDVGVVEDLPSVCTSPYLINVTSIGEDGLLGDAGFSNTFVHLGAPGVAIYGLTGNNNYSSRTGTSAASPMVAGLAGLINTIPCTALEELKLSNPSKHALTIADIIKKGVKLNPALKNKTITGGQLDALGALREVTRFCPLNVLIPANKGKLTIDKLSLNDNNLQLEYTTPSFVPYRLSVLDVAQKVLFTISFTPKEYGINALRIGLPSMPQGLYLIILQGPTQSTFNYLLKD